MFFLTHNTITKNYFIVSDNHLSSITLVFWCRGPDSNRHSHYEPKDFKSFASTNSATPAYAFFFVLLVAPFLKIILSLLLMEAAPGFEPGMEDLQSSALPLGYAALFLHNYYRCIISANFSVLSILISSF